MKIGLDDIAGLSRNTTPNLMKQILSWARHKSLLAETAAFQWHFLRYIDGRHWREPKNLLEGTTRNLLPTRQFALQHFPLRQTINCNVNKK